MITKEARDKKEMKTKIGEVMKAYVDELRQSEIRWSSDQEIQEYKWKCSFYTAVRTPTPGNT